MNDQSAGNDYDNRSNHREMFVQKSLLIGPRSTVQAEFSTLQLTRAYLQHCKANALNNTPRKVLSARSGYAKANKFLDALDAFPQLDEAIPRSLLEDLGVDLNVLVAMVEIDAEAYDKELQKPLLATTFIERIMPAAYSSTKFPQALNEDDAIAFVLQSQECFPHKCCIPFGELLTIWVYEDGSVYRQYHRPGINIDEKTVRICQRSNVVGRTMVV